MRGFDSQGQRMSFSQRIVERITSTGRFAAMERESREWIVTCPECGYEGDFWEMGGIRYKAASVGKRMRARCPSCGKRSMHSVERRASSGSANNQAPLVED